MAWAVLVGAGLLEVVWAIALKHTNGFTRFWPSLIGVSAAVISFVMLSSALKSLPVGTAYAVWVGIGALGVALAGIVALGESAAPLRVGFLALILIGVVGLKLVDGQGAGGGLDHCPPQRHLEPGRAVPGSRATLPSTSGGHPCRALACPDTTPRLEQRP